MFHHQQWPARRETSANSVSHELRGTGKQAPDVPPPLTPTHTLQTMEQFV